MRYILSSTLYIATVNFGYTSVVTSIEYPSTVSVIFHVIVGMGKGDAYEDDSLDVFQYFNTSCFTGFEDDKEVCFLSQ